MAAPRSHVAALAAGPRARIGTTLVVTTNDCATRSVYRIYDHRRWEPIGDALHASIDRGRTFIDLSTVVLPADSGPRLGACETAGRSGRGDDRRRVSAVAARP